MKLINNRFISVYIFALLLTRGHCSKNEGNCIFKHENNTEMVSDLWEKGITLNSIKDTAETGTKLLRFSVSHDAFLFDLRINNQSEFSYVIDFDVSAKNFFHIQLAEDFSKYENKEISSNMIIKLYFRCPNKKNSVLIVNQPIVDTNNHKPIFINPETLRIKNKYTLKLPMVIEKDFEFDLSDKLMVRDVDLTNKNITLTMKNDIEEKTGFKFIVGNTDLKDKKNYLVKLRTSKSIILKQNLTFSLLATDSGNPSLNTSINMTIIADKEKNLPQFSEPVYTSDLISSDYKNLKEKPNNVQLNFFQGDILLKNAYMKFDAFEIRGISQENENRFKIFHYKTKPNNLLIKIELCNISRQFLKQRSLAADLIAIHGDLEVKTQLHILLPKISEDDHSISNNVVSEKSAFNYLMATTFLFVVSVCAISFLLYKMIIKREFIKTAIIWYKSDFKTKDTYRVTDA